MHARMLANVESRKMKPKSTHLAQERIHDQLGQPLSAVHRQALANQREIALELTGCRICLGAGNLFTAMAQANHHQVQQSTIEFRARNPRLAGATITPPPTPASPPRV